LNQKQNFFSAVIPRNPPQKRRQRC
jgi:hypothetical protein